MNSAAARQDHLSVDLAEGATATETPPVARSAIIPAKVYATMAVTTVLTFATLTTGYQLLFPPHPLFA